MHKVCARVVALLMGLLLPPLASAETKSAGKVGPLRGQILALPRTGKLGEQQVFIDGQQAVTVRDGRFVSRRVGPRYDAWLVDKANQAVTVYRGLTRRDPALQVRGDGSAQAETRKGTVHGLLRGDFSFPVGRGSGLNVYFFAEEAEAFWQAHPLEWGDGVAAGPRFGRMRVAWSGAEAVRGQLLALAETAEEKTRFTGAWLARAPLTVTDGKEVYAEMTLHALPIGHIAGSVSIDGQDAVRELGVYYQLPGRGGRLALGSCPVHNTYDCRLPDLSDLGGAYCVHLDYQFPPRYQAQGSSTRCGGKLGMTDFSVRVRPEPKWVGGATELNVNSTLTWTDQGEHVYRVLLAPSYDSPIQGPVIHIYTSQTSVRWPGVKPLGMPFPVGASYRCEVTRLSPRTSVDELAARGGFDQDSDYDEAETTPLKLTMVGP